MDATILGLNPKYGLEVIVPNFEKPRFSV